MSQITNENTEVANMLAATQPPELKVRIDCACGGHSQDFHIFFSEQRYLAAINQLSPENRVNAILSYILSERYYDTIDLQGKCDQCGAALATQINFV